MGLGSAFKRSREAQLGALTLGLCIVATDLALQHLRPAWLAQTRVPLTWLALLSLGALAKWDLASLGLQLTPKQGWRYWIKATAAIALVAVVLIAGASGIFYLMGRDLSTPSRPWPFSAILRFFVNACLEAPLYEETIYRFAFCVGFIALLGRWPTIILSGLVFAWLHFLYGNPGPDNFIGGYILAWAFVRSESLAVPILLHALGNLVVLISLVVMS